MTVENLHDAIGQLPGELIAETDRLRTQKRKIIPWQRYAAMAACAVLILGASYGITMLASPKSCDSASGAPEMMMQDAAVSENEAGTPAEAPAAAEPMAKEPVTAAPEEAGKTTAAQENEVEELCGLPTYAAEETTVAGASHGHSPAQKGHLSIDRAFQVTGETPWAAISFGDSVFTLEGESAAILRDILFCLPCSEENLCRCIPEFTVDTEDGAGYEVSLTQYFVRYNGRQASLTEEEAAQIQEILNGLEIGN